MARCTRCGKQVEEAKYKRCQHCREVANERNAWIERYEAYKLAGKCVRCGKDVEPGYVQCVQCRQHQREKYKRLRIQKDAAKQGKTVAVSVPTQRKSDCKCDYCSKATSVLCRWIGNGDRTDVVLRERMVEDKLLSRPYTVAMVIECDRFDGSNNGKLPAITGNGRVPGNQRYPPNVVQGV